MLCIKIFITSWQVKYLILIFILLTLDYFVSDVPFTVSSRTERALIDNLGHGVTGFISWLMVRCYNESLLTERLVLMESLICLMVSSCIDLDHFVQAASLSIINATSLPYRPLLHCSTVLIFIVLVFLVISLHYNLWWMHTLSFICLTGWTCHHLRDALRRGLWFCPLTSTPVIPYKLYLIIMSIQPVFIANLMEFSAILVIRRKYFRPISLNTRETSCCEEEIV